MTIKTFFINSEKTAFVKAYMLDNISGLKFCEKRPAVIVFPGGGYEFCSDREGEPIALQYLAQGYNAFVVNYTCNARFPASLIDAAYTFYKIRMRAEEFGVDKDKLAVLGCSAGGHLAGMLATMTSEKPVLEALKDKASLSKPDAVVLSYPVIAVGKYEHKGSFDKLSGNDQVLRPTLSLETRVKEDSVPAFIWSTGGDKGVPCENSFMMALAYRNKGVPFELHVFENGEHGLSLANEEVITPNAPVAAWKEMAVTWLENRGFIIK